MDNIVTAIAVVAFLGFMWMVGFYFDISSMADSLRKIEQHLEKISNKR